MRRGLPILTRRAWYEVYLIPYRFAILLAFILIFLIGPPIVVGFGISNTWFDLLTSLIVLTLILSLCAERPHRFFALSLGIPTIVFALSGYAFSGAVSVAFRVSGHICSILFLFGSAMIIVQAIFRDHKLTIDSILGTVCGYLFMGLGWAQCYGLIESQVPGGLAIGPALKVASERASEFPHLLVYYSFVTLTTVGFGDITPVSPTLRTLAWLEATSGQFYLAVVVAALVSSLASMRRNQDDPR